jgi:hypothetical protein
MGCRDPNAIHKAYIKPMQKIFSVDRFGYNIGRKNKNEYPKYELKLFRDQEYSGNIHN